VRGQKELSYQTFAAFRERYANQYIVVANSKGRWETAPAAPIWLTHPHRRQYEGLDLVPIVRPYCLTATLTFGRVGVLSRGRAVGG
jgi:hypothetical protein